MGFIGSAASALGTVLSKDKGSGFQAKQAPALNPVEEAQFREAMQQVAAARGASLGALDMSGDKLAQQQAFVNALNAQGGLGNQASVFSQQQALANQLQGVANGTGPNPALDQLNQTTAQNIQNQAALMGSQRGTGANPALLARQIANMGANTQQQAVQQAATLAASQQLGAMGALGQQQANMGNLATTQVGQQAQGLQNLNSFAQNQAVLRQQQQQLEQGQQVNLSNAINQQNTNNTAMQSNMNAANAHIAAQNAATQGNIMTNLLGGMFKGAGGVLGKMGSNTAGGNTAGPGEGGLGASTSAGASAGGGGGSSGGGGGGGFAAGGMIGDDHRKSFIYKHFSKGGMSMKSDKMVPGQAPVPGDSLKNDIVDAKLSPGEIVIPRSIALAGKMAPELAAKFVAAVLAEHGKLG